MCAFHSSNMRIGARVLWMQQGVYSQTSRGSPNHTHQKQVIFSVMIALVSLLLNEISRAMCSTVRSGIEQAADTSQGSPKIAPLKSKLCFPQARTLICWAAKYFDAWLESEKNPESATMMTIKARGWKFGTIQDFFKLKDSMYQKEYQDCDDPAHGGWGWNDFSF